ncbi:hypothetical protein IQ283_09190 (plasmid) [Alkalihalobacillus hwajinpoensis]|uniref:hypothetical protein n=1 Tax=Guptibacillus hwajinpoensis TaxID=208199 RepID=UPI001884226B|nr:hypothetical protein [Pseudalkalibacillus hwajinpoensis]MBF0706782.1 hypothetical protein [Pseudalkalibacillus hwajinpoensis]
MTIQANNYKLFLKTDLFDEKNSNLKIEYTGESYLICSYNYSNKDSYLNTLKNAFYAGTKQFIINPQQYLKLIKLAKDYNLKPKTIEFNDEIDEEDQAYINDLLAKFVQYDLIKADINNPLDEEINNFDLNQDIIPKKLLISKDGDSISIFNNGVLHTDNIEIFEYLNPIFSQLADEVNQ